MDGQAEVKEEPSWVTGDDTEEEDGGELQPPLEVYLKTEYCDEQEPGANRLDARVNSPGENGGDEEEEDDDDICHIQPDVLIHTPDVDPLQFPSAACEPEPETKSEQEAGKSPGPADSGPDAAESGPNAAESGPDVAESGPDAADSVQGPEDSVPGPEDKPSSDQVDTEEKAYLCKGCPMSYSTLTYLKTHEKYCRKLKVSTRKSRKTSLATCTAKVFVCPVCDHTSTTHSNHKQHLLMHSGAKPHRCPDCDTGFSRRCDMNRHLLTHRGEKPYACGVCGMRFVQSAHLTQHSRVHTGARPHACDICGMCFAQSSHANTHARRVHGEGATVLARRKSPHTVPL